MKTIYYLPADVAQLDVLSLNQNIPTLPWITGIEENDMLCIEAPLNDAEVAQLAAYMPSVVKGVKPGTRCGSPTGGK